MKKLEYDKLTIYEVEDLHKKLLEYSQKMKSDLTLDLSSVQKIDMTAVQLLLSTQKTCKEQLIPFSLVNVSQNLKYTLKACGCDTILGVSND